MTKTLEAVFDGEVLRFEEPLESDPNTRVLVTIQTISEENISDEKAAPWSFLDTAMSLNLEGPPDWSENLDEYLYGNKRGT